MYNCYLFVSGSRRCPVPVVSAAAGGGCGEFLSLVCFGEGALFGVVNPRHSQAKLQSVFGRLYAEAWASTPNCTTTWRSFRGPTPRRPVASLKKSWASFNESRPSVGQLTFFLPWHLTPGVLRDKFHLSLGPPAIGARPLTPFLVGRVRDPTKIDYRKKHRVPTF